jgi:hypothetical protein
MLQIVSGKFFKSEERHRHDAFGMLYSNVSCSRTVTTSVATLHPVDPHGSVTRYVVTYTNQIERDSDAAAAGSIALVRTGDEEIIEQFRLLLIFGLRGFFATERRQVEHTCRTRPASANDYVPSSIVDRFCDARLDVHGDDIARFETLVRDVIGLRRKTYVAVMAYLANFVHALEAADTNIDLAYSMLIYGIEALSQQFGVFEPRWSDYDSKVRARIDKLLSHDTNLLFSVRAALLQEKPVRLRQRAAAFVEEHLPEEFFEGEHLKLRKLPLRYSLVGRSIRNAYELRSKFVHTLEGGAGFHQWGADFDMLIPDREPLLTFRGLVRVAEAVVRQFVSKQEQVETEEIDWRSELPNVFSAPLAPKYWIWRVEDFEPTRAHTRLTAFLDQTEDARSGGAMTDLAALLNKVEDLIAGNNGSIPSQRAMACLYVLYHRLVGRSVDGELTPRKDVWDRCNELLAPCTVESVVCWLLLGIEFPWPRDDCREVVSGYSRDKFARSSIQLRAQTEAALFAALGNMYLETPADPDTARFWFRKARLELVGHPEKQNYVRECEAKGLTIDLVQLMRAAVTTKAQTRVGEQ